MYGEIWNFDNDTLGLVPRGFVSKTGEWKIVADETTGSKPHVLAQLSQNETSNFNVLLLESGSYKDLTISVNLKPVSGEDDQGGGIIWRWQDEMNYYVARYNPLEGNVRAYKVADGQRSQLKGVVIRHESGWHNLKVSMRGSRMECFFDARKLFELDDSTFVSAGKVGLWSKADAVSNFDDLSVEEISGSSGQEDASVAY